ncbi:hypothetical protein A1D22_10835 [Pasteurellaceae bacterium LFhippo2]|nr:hypothetical protein [Pasteurellaceae bacterium LFhippo2]
MLKEKGYDEFLAEKIKLGREDVEAGRVLTLAQSRTRTRAVIERKAKELAEFERSQLLYG